MRKFVKKFNIFAALLLVALVLVSCQFPNQGGGNQDHEHVYVEGKCECGETDPNYVKPEPEELVITWTGLEAKYTYNTGDVFNKDVLLSGVTITDQNGKSYIENVVVNGIDSIPLNEDGTLKQAGNHTLRLNVVIDGNTVSTKMVTVEVKFVMVETNDIIYNGDFETGTVDPFVNTNVDGGVSTMEVVDKQLVLKIEALSWQAAFPRIDYGAVDSESRFSLEDGKYYEVSFDAYATVSRHVHVQVGQLFSADPWFADALPVQQYILLGTEMETHSFRFQANAALADISVLSLLFGHGTLPAPYISEVCDVVYDNIKIVEVDSLGEDTMAPSISAADKSIYVGTAIDVAALATISDDQDNNPSVEIKIEKDGAVVEAVDTSAPGVYNITYTAKDAAGNEASKSIVLTVKEKPSTSMPIENGDEKASAANGGWIEWHDQNWTGSNVAVSEALVGPQELKLSYQVTSGSCWFGMQLFYTDAAIPTGEISVILDINSSVAGKVTIAGQVVELVEGANHVEITGATGSSGATFSMQFGVLDDGEGNSTNLPGGTFVISSLSINGIAVIGEGVAAPGFDLGFLEEAGAVAAPGTIGYWNDQWWCGSNVTVEQAKFHEGTLTVSYSMEGFCSWGLQIFLDDASVAVGETKSVSLKIVADAAGEIMISGNVVALEVGENNITVDITKADGKAFFVLIFGNTAANTAISQGTFIISDCELFDSIVAPTPEQPGEGEDPETPVVEIPASGLLEADLSKWIAWADGSQAIKAEVVEGKLVLTLNSTGAAANYSPQFKLEKIAFEAGKTYKVEIVLNSSVARAIQVMLQENGGSWAVIASPIHQLAAGEETTISFEVTAAASYTNAIFGLMLGALEGAATPEGEHVITISKLSLEVVEGGSEQPGEGEEPETPVVSNTIKNGAEGDAVANPGNFIEWHDQNWCGSNVVISEATYADGILKLSYVQTGACWFGMQLFYSDAAIPAGEIVVKMIIKSSVAGQITIAGQVVELVAGENVIEVNGKTASATLSMQFGVEAAGTSIAEGSFEISEISIAVKAAGEQPGEGEEPEQPSQNEYFTVEAMATTGAANHFMIKWTDAEHAVSLAPSKDDCGVSIGAVANFELYDLNVEQSLVRFNIITGAEPARNVSIVLHTAAGDYKLTMAIVDGAYSGQFTVEKVDCGHGTTEQPGEGEEPEQPSQNEYFTVEAMATTGAANHFMIKWTDAEHAVTLKPTKADCGVSIGIVANFEHYDLTADLVRFNIITGAEPARNVSIVLHTEAGDYKVTMMIVDGAYSGQFTVEKVECGHSVSEEPGEEIVVNPGNLELIEAYIYSGNHAGLRFKVADVAFDSSYTFEVSSEQAAGGRIIEKFQYGADGIQINYFLGGAAESGVTYVFNIRILSGETVLAEGQIAVKA